MCNIPMTEDEKYQDASLLLPPDIESHSAGAAASQDW